MEKKQSSIKFKLETDRSMTAPSDAGANLIKKQRIMIRPVVNLPKTEIANPLNLKEEYDPSQPTTADDEQELKVDEVYDPFQPTLSDDDDEDLIDKNDQKTTTGFSTFSKVGSFKPLPQSTKNDLLNDLDIDQMLDSQYNEATSIKKRPKQFSAIAKLKGNKSSVKNDFDIFAEEELEKAQAAAITPALKPSEINQVESSAKDNLSINEQKIESAFGSQAEPPPDTSEDALQLEDSASNLIFSEQTTDPSFILPESSSPSDFQLDRKTGILLPDNKSKANDDISLNVSIGSAGIKSDINEESSLNQNDFLYDVEDNSSKNQLKLNLSDQENAPSEKSSTTREKTKSSEKEDDTGEVSKQERRSNSLSTKRSHSSEKSSTRDDHKKKRSRSRDRKKSRSRDRKRSRSRDRKKSRSRDRKRSRSRNKKRSRSRDRKRSRSRDRRRSRSRKRRTSRSRDRRRSRSHSYSRHSSKKASKSSRRDSSSSQSRRRSRSNSHKSRRSDSKYKRKDHSSSRSKRRRSRSESLNKRGEKRRKRSSSRQRSSKVKLKSRHSRSKTPVKKSKHSKRSRSRSTSCESSSTTKISSRKRAGSGSSVIKSDLKIFTEDDNSAKHSNFGCTEVAVSVEQGTNESSQVAVDKIPAASSNLSTFSDVEDDSHVKKKKKKKSEKEKRLSKELEGTDRKKKKSKKYNKQASGNESDIQSESLKSLHIISTHKSAESEDETDPIKRSKLSNPELLSDNAIIEKSSKRSKKHKHHKQVAEAFNQDRNEEQLSKTSEHKRDKKRSKKDNNDNNLTISKANNKNDFENSRREDIDKATSCGSNENANVKVSGSIDELENSHTLSFQPEIRDIKVSGYSTPTNMDKPNDSVMKMSDDLFAVSQNRVASPLLSSPALSPSNLSADNIGSQNSSMLVSSQELTETPSYAETFLEQSRKRWEKSLRNKSPHISSTVTPDDNSASESSKLESKPLPPDNTELSSLSDVSVDVTKRSKMHSGENSTMESSFSVEDIFAESPSKPSSHKEAQAYQPTLHESVISITENSGSLEAFDIKTSGDNDVSSLKDTDFRNLLNSMPAPDSNKQLIVQGETDSDKNAKDTSKETAVRSSPREKRSSSRSSNRRSERRKEDRRKRSRSRSRDRRSKHRKSSSRSPRRKRSYESHRSSHSKRRSSDISKSPARRHRSRNSKSKYERSKVDISLKERRTGSPKKELLDMFLEQTTEFTPIFTEKTQDPLPPNDMFTSPQPIATISGISSALFTHDVRPEEAHLHPELESHLHLGHDIETNTFKELVNESRPALIQIPTIDSHTSEYDKTKNAMDQANVSTAAVPESKETDLYSPSCPMSPFSPAHKDDTPSTSPPPPPPLKVTSSAEVSSTTPSAAASLFSKLLGLKKESLTENIESSLKQDAAKDKDAENVLNPTQILSIAGLNPQQQSAAKDAIMSIAELSKQLQLGQILSNVEKSKGSPSAKKEADGLSPVNIDSIESSAVALYNSDRQKSWASTLGFKEGRDLEVYLAAAQTGSGPGGDNQQKKKDFQEKVVTAAKLAIKPHYERREVSKEQYKDIMKRAVNKRVLPNALDLFRKICQTDKNMEVNDVKVRRLIRRYVECYQQKNEKKKEKMKFVLDQKIKKHTKVNAEDFEFVDSPPSPESSPFDVPYSPTDDDPVLVPTLLKKEPRKIITLPDLPLPPPPPPPRPKYMM